MTAYHDFQPPYPRPAPAPAPRGSRFAALSMALGLDDILETLSRRKAAIALVGAAALCLAFLAVTATSDNYTAHAELTIDPRGLDAVEKELTPPDATPEGRATMVNTLMQVLVSDSVLARVVEAQGLDKDEEFVGKRGLLSALKASLRALIGGGGEPADTRLVALTSLKEAVGVTLTPSSFVVHLSATTEEPDKSRRLVDAIIRSFIEQQAASRRTEARKISESLNGRLEELRGQVAKAENRIEAFKEENNIVDAGGRLNNEQQLTEQTNQLGLARTRTAEMRARYELIRDAAGAGAGAENLPEAVRSQTITQLRAQYAQTRQRLDSLTATHGPRHPQLQETRVQTESLERQITDELKRIAASARRDYEQAKATEVDLARRLAALKEQSGDVNQSLVRLRQLEREAKASRDIYENFLTRARQIHEQEDIDTSNINVISPALLPLKADGPPAAIVLFIALMAGLSLGAIGAVLFDAFSGIIHSPRALVAQSGLSVIASLPLVRAGRSPLRRKQDPRIEIVVEEMRDDETTRAFLAVYDTLKQHTHGPGPQVVLVTSPGREGAAARAAMALNLAITADLCGERVMLVDFDLSEARISRALRGPAAAGLDGVLGDRWPLQHALHGLAGTHVAVLPNFRLDPAAAHAGPDTIGRAVIGPAHQCGMIVIDAGAAGEAGPLGALAEVASDILVAVRAGGVRLGALEQIRRALGANAAKVPGAVYLTVAKPATGGDRINHAAWSPLAPGMPGAAPYGDGRARNRYYGT